MKRIFASILLSLMTGSLFAYTIGQELTIENKTATDLVIDINKLYNQAAVTRSIPAHSTIKIYTENGDNSGLLYQLGTAKFAIKDAKKLTEYINGKISFYVGSSYRDKRSFLSSLSSGKGINLDLNYSCLSQGNGKVFNNKIVINGEPSAPTYDKPGSGGICSGILSSTLDEQLTTYEMNCASDPKSTKLLYAIHCMQGRMTNKGPITRCIFRNLNTGGVGRTSDFICTKDVKNCIKKLLDIELGETGDCRNVRF